MNDTEKVDIIIDSGFIGITVDKNFYSFEGKHKITMYFNNARIHLKVNDTDLLRFKKMVFTK